MLQQHHSLFASTFFSPLPPNPVDPFHHPIHPIHRDPHPAPRTARCARGDLHHRALVGRHLRGLAHQRTLLLGGCRGPKAELVVAMGMWCCFFSWVDIHAQEKKGWKSSNHPKASHESSNQPNYHPIITPIIPPIIWIQYWSQFSSNHPCSCNHLIIISDYHQSMVWAQGFAEV